MIIIINSPCCGDLHSPLPLLMAIHTWLGRCCCLSLTMMVAGSVMSMTTNNDHFWLRPTLIKAPLMSASTLIFFLHFSSTSLLLPASSWHRAFRQTLSSSFEIGLEPEKFQWKKTLLTSRTNVDDFLEIYQIQKVLLQICELFKDEYKLDNVGKIWA